MADGPVKHSPPAILALADGSVFIGTSFGAEGETVGEVVFNTSMTGYQEILTDPSYTAQMVTFTYPHIGNVGINVNDQESDRIWLAGVIIRDLSPVVSNWRSQKDLASYLKEQNIVAIKDIDTRRLTRIIREKGAQNGCMITGTVDPQQAIKKAQAFPGIQGQDLAKQVTTKKIYEWKSATLDLDQPHKPIPSQLYHLVVYDYGVKSQILRLLVDRGCRVTVVPATMAVKEILSLQPDGVVLANGPGDPMVCDYAIQQARELLSADVPLLGICLGFQLLALACGAKTQKMKFGHHGANHPVLDERSKRVYITSQNHGFDVVESTLPESLEITHRSLFDRSLQGLRHRYKPALAFQGHPEASPGPQEMTDLFDEFIQLMRSSQAKNKQVRENHAR